MSPSLLNRLYLIFLAEVEKIRGKHLWWDAWNLYLDRHGILHGHTDDLIEVYNDSGFGDGVLIRCPSDDMHYLLVPPEFAEKVLVLGFPDDIVGFAEGLGRRQN